MARAQVEILKEVQATCNHVIRDRFTSMAHLYEAVVVLDREIQKLGGRSALPCVEVWLREMLERNGVEPGE